MKIRLFVHPNCLAYKFGGIHVVHVANLMAIVQLWVSKGVEHHQILLYNKIRASSSWSVMILLVSATSLVTDTLSTEIQEDFLRHLIIKEDIHTLVHEW
jgi:hypothetical protein